MGSTNEADGRDGRDGLCPSCCGATVMHPDRHPIAATVIAATVIVVAVIVVAVIVVAVIRRTWPLCRPGAGPGIPLKGAVASTKLTRCVSMGEWPGPIAARLPPGTDRAAGRRRPRHDPRPAARTAPPTWCAAPSGSPGRPPQPRGRRGRA
ncbi:hypothetical protein GCM10012280_15830 [Wenjunlia tyrosinilytica]|uniref:Uncharacterized protein n=1 Tax=Wenjunlia tyrosinilytica TaxID=1544741 RepID=A0A918DVK9_9ACTN|nr:hypothetical protein GCM10012280_15830 [Wenjunlia tyrosinilytica]